LESAAAFAAVSRAWLRAGWDTKYVSSPGSEDPSIQLPDDLTRVQEVVYGVTPDVTIETGVAHGGSLVFYASLRIRSAIAFHVQSAPVRGAPATCSMIRPQR
jgi:cephalosporin hydroxylase